MRIAAFLTRWALIVLLSVVIIFPPIWAVSSWGVERAEAEQRASRPKPLPAGQKDFGFGLRGLDALILYTSASFVVLWPLSLWASWRLLRGVGQRRRAPAPVAAKTEHTDLVVTRGQVLGASVPGADFAESAVPVPAAAEADDLPDGSRATA